MANHPDTSRDEPTLPHMPHPSNTNTSLGPGRSRKRPYPLGAPFPEPSLSSDLGIFSSDDDPALDNYFQARQKKRYVGTWFDHRHLASDPASAEVEAHDDEAEEKEVDDLSVVVEREEDDTLQEVSLEEGCFYRERSLSDEAQLDGVPKSVSSRKATSAEAALKEADLKHEIECHIDDGNEMIDLSTRGLDDDHVGSDAFRPLVDLKFVPHVPAPRYCSHRRNEPLHSESKMHLFLGNNSISRLPGALFSIENLTTLSLRANKLTELPPAIGRCHNLRSLNLAVNRLRYLPFELIENIGMLDTLQLAGNNFYEADRNFWRIETGEDEAPEGESSRNGGDGHDAHHTPWCPSAWYLGRGAVQFNDTSGQVYSAFKIPPKGGSQDPIQIQDPGDHELPLPHFQGGHRQLPAWNLFGPTPVPSLVELCARSLVNASRADEYTRLSMQEQPALVASTIDAAARVEFQGGQRCAICRKPFVLPRSLWVEFFYVEMRPGTRLYSGEGLPSGYQTEEDNVIPCLRKGCSWRCVPCKSELQSGQRVPLKT